MTSLEFIQEGQTWFDKHEFERAIECYSQAIALETDSKEALIGRAICSGYLGRFDNALIDATTAISLDSSDPFPFVIRAKAEANLGNHEGAIRDYSRAIELNSLQANAYRGRGAAKANSGNEEEALSDLTKCLELDESDVEAFILRGEILFHRGIFQSAINDFDRAILIAPLDPRGYGYRGSARCSLELYSAGIKDFDKALELKPNDAWVLFQRSTAKHEIGDDSGAMEDLKQSVAANPKNRDAWANLAHLFGPKDKENYWRCICNAAVLGDNVALKILSKYVYQGLAAGQKPSVIVKSLARYGMASEHAEHFVGSIEKMVEGERIASRQLVNGNSSDDVRKSLMKKGYAEDKADEIVQTASRKVHPPAEVMQENALGKLDGIEKAASNGRMWLLFGAATVVISLLLDPVRVYWPPFFIGLVALIGSFLKKKSLFLRMPGSRRPLPRTIECPNCGCLLELDDRERIRRVFFCPECSKTIDMNLASN